MEQKTKTISAAILMVMLSSLTFLGGVNLGDDDLYYCEDRAIVMKCDSLSKYVLPNGKCNNAEIGNKICKTGDGWISIEVAEMQLSEPEVEDEDILGLQYSCNFNGCYDEEGNQVS